MNKMLRPKKKDITAGDKTNVLTIRGKILYSRDGYIFTYLKLYPVSLDLLSIREKTVLSNILCAELSKNNKPFKLLALSRPIDITPLLDEYEMIAQMSHDEKQKELLRCESAEMKSYQDSGEVLQRQFFVVLWEDSFEKEESLTKRAKELSKSFEAASIRCETLNEEGIITLMNMLHNPAALHLEDRTYRESIPILKNMKGSESA